MAAFVKGLSPNHLVMLGTIGMFGASTPALTKLNPFDLVGDTTSKGGIYSADPICQVRLFFITKHIPCVCMQVAIAVRLVLLL